MLPPPMICEWARRLIASEADAERLCEQTDLATIRVYERLRRQLCAPVGVGGFQAIASRALSLAKSQSPRLSGVQLTASGGLRGLGDVEIRVDTNEDGEVGVILIAQLLGLLLTFLGEATTLRLMEDVGVENEVKTELDATVASNLTGGMSYFGPFEDILLEADQLRNVSERLEISSGKHAGIEQELVSVAGNVRSVAAVLDIFTLIRSKAGGAQEDTPNSQAKGYVN